MKLLIATGNPGKFEEISAVLSGLPLSLLSLEDVTVDSSGLVEDGETYRENAYKKAIYFAGQTGLPTLADDSGIMVNVLKGELGIKTRRWGAGENATDREWIDYSLNRMKEAKDRTAKFICQMCLVNGKGDILFESYGETKGQITEELLAPIKPGIPLSSCFIVDGHDKVHSAMSIEEKNEISHRGKAAGQIRKYLETNLDSFSF